MFSSVAAIENGMFVMFIGLLLILIYTNGTLSFSSTLMRKAVFLSFELIILSLVTSVLLLNVFGELYGKNTLSASFSKNIYYALLAVTFFFNAYLFDFLDKEMMRKLMDISCWITIVVGFLQILIILQVPGVRDIYDNMDVLDVLVQSNKIINIGRVCATRVEPANMTISICVYLLPYSMSRVIHEKDKRKYIFFIIALTVICFYGLSSAVLVAILGAFAVFIYFTAKKTRTGSFVLFLLVAAIITLMLIGTGALDETEFGEKVSYLLMEKTTNTSNLSSGYRYTTVVNDLVCFLKYPVTGVGNGNQGFLYNSTMNSDWVTEAMRTNYQTVKAMSGANGVLSGGAFVPSFISGYGLVGIILLCIYISAVKKKLAEVREQMNYYYEWFYIGSITFLIVSTVAGSIEGNYIVMFIFSLPFAAEHNIILPEGNQNHGQQQSLLRRRA
jgi:hypothetical protein